MPQAFGRGLTASEVEQVLTAPGEDRPGALGSRIAIGQTAAGWHIRVIYVPEPDPQSAFVITAFTLEGPPLRAYQWRRKAGRSRPVTTDKYPRGWNGERVERVLSRYETQPSMTAVAEDEAALQAPGQTVMTIPTELVPAGPRADRRTRTVDTRPVLGPGVPEVNRTPPPCSAGAFANRCPASRRSLEDGLAR